MKKILYGALALLVLASCNKNEEITVPSNGNYPSDGVVRISTTVNDLKTRSGATPYTGNTLSVSLDYGVGDQYTQSNIEWASEDNGATWEPSRQMLWKNATTAAKAYAFAPFVEGDDLTAVPFTVQQDQSTGIESSDLLGYVNNSFIPGSSLTSKNELNIDLSHKLSKLTLNLTFGSQFETDPTIESVSINSVQPTVSYNAATGVATASGSATTIKMHALSAASYEVIFPAQTISASTKMLTVVLTNGNMYNYTVPLTGHIFVSGAAYTMNLKVGKEKIELEDVTVADWNTGDEIPGGEATEQPKAQIGDYFYQDGSYSSSYTPDAANPCIGIVFWVDPTNATKGKIVSLDEKNDIPWTTNAAYYTSFPTQAVSTLNGLENMKAIKNINSDYSDFPPFAWCVAKTTGGLTWYLPASKELRQLFAASCGLRWVESGADATKNEINDWDDWEVMTNHANYITARTTFNALFTAASSVGGTILNQTEEYLSSTEAGSSDVWTVYFGRGDTFADTRDFSSHARAIAKF